MIQFQSESTKLATGSAAGRRGQMSTAAVLASAALVALTLAACSSLPQSFPATGVTAQYPNLNDPPPRTDVRADQVAQMKTVLIQVRDDPSRTAIQQQALR